MHDLDRDQIAIGGEDRRIYYDESSEQMGLSVSTITDIRDTPDKDEAIEGWKYAYDGSDDDSYPHHEEQKVYKQLRGTLGHYAILSNLGDVPKGDEEDEAEHILKHWDEERPSMQQDDVTHIGDDHAYEGEQAWSKCMRDISWVTNQFQTIAQQWDISPETTVACEDYVSYEPPLYSGQFDLLYEGSDGVTTLCDLKLASGIRYDYKLQIAAYRNAILHDDEYPDKIPRVQIIRLHPDTEDIEVQTNDGDGAYIQESVKVSQAKDLRDDGRPQWVDGDIDTMKDSWWVDARYDLPPWDESLDDLTDEFLDLAETASDEWLTQLTFDEFMSRINNE